MPKKYVVRLTDLERSELQNIIKKLKGGAKFEDLAKTESMDNNKAQGGDLGWFTTTKMGKPFGDAVKTLKKGEYTKTPVQSQFVPMMLGNVHDETMVAARR